MSNQIRVQYLIVNARVNKLQAELEAGLKEMEAEYKQIESMLRNEVDGATTAALISAMERNKLKAHATGETLRSLLEFLKNSTQHVEAQERIFGNHFRFSSDQFRVTLGGRN